MKNAFMFKLLCSLDEITYSNLNEKKNTQIEKQKYDI